MRGDEKLLENSFDRDLIKMISMTKRTSRKRRENLMRKMMMSILVSKKRTRKRGMPIKGTSRNPL